MVEDLRAFARLSCDDVEALLREADETLDATGSSMISQSLTAQVQAIYPGTALIHDIIRTVNASLAVKTTKADDDALRRVVSLLPRLRPRRPCGGQDLRSTQAHVPRQEGDETAGRFRTANDHLELMSLDLSTVGSDRRASISETPTRTSARESRATRTDAPTRTPGDARRLDGNRCARRWLPHAFDIATAPGPDAVGQAAGLAASTATKVYDAANDLVMRIGAKAGTVMEGLLDLDLAGAPVLPPNVDDFLRDIEGYDELFGHAAACACEPCQSILGPAAYFVDLMRFVEDNVSSEFFSGDQSTDRLALRVRRPDLWSVPLTCEATNTVVPTLNLVNSVLETQTVWSPKSESPPSDEEARKQAETALAEQVDSFDQPYDLPLERARTRSSEP